MPVVDGGDAELGRRQTGAGQEGLDLRQQALGRAAHGGHADGKFPIRQWAQRPAAQSQYMAHTNNNAKTSHNKAAMTMRLQQRELGLFVRLFWHWSRTLGMERAAPGLRESGRGPASGRALTNPPSRAAQSNVTDTSRRCAATAARCRNSAASAYPRFGGGRTSAGGAEVGYRQPPQGRSLCPEGSATANVRSRGSYRLGGLRLSAMLSAQGHTRAPPARFPLPDRAFLGSSSAVWPCLPCSCTVGRAISGSRIAPSCGTGGSAQYG